MDKPLIMLTSITYAMKSKDILMKNGISSYIIRTANSNKDFGCGYSLHVPKDIDRAADILKENGIKILKIDKGG